MNALLSFAAEAMNGALHGDDRQFNGVSTDSRSIGKDELFVALSGPNFDGNKFVSDASNKGAAGAVVSSLVNVDVAQIEVDDTRVALGRLAAAWRDEHDVTVVGVTGSNGKTTLKELIAACLSSVAETLATEGNLNNDIGMPLMMSRISKSHRYAVLEMGANHAGEIAYLTGSPGRMSLSSRTRRPHTSKVSVRSKGLPTPRPRSCRATRDRASPC